MPVLLAIIPHPDDESYSFSGTIALAAAAGWRCFVVAVTSGEKGRRHDGGPPEPALVGAAREAELAASCALLGAEPPRFLRMPDGGLKAIPADVGRACIASLIDGIQPDMLLALGADGAYGHPDHLAVHAWVRACWVALRAARPALLYRVFPPGLFLPQYELCIGMMGDPPHPAAAEIGGEGAHYTVDTLSVGVARRASIAAHRTQLPGGRPNALFPADIVSRLLAGPERFDDATGVIRPEVERLLGALHSA